MPGPNLSVRKKGPTSKKASLPKKDTAPTKVSISTTDLQAIENYVEGLKRAGTDRAAFEQVFKILTLDTKLKKADLTKVAHQYSGDVIKYKSKAAAHEEINRAFVRKARFINKLL
jgi:hypothetical protein